MRTTIYLIRHGETDWNRDGRWQGHVDIPLNAVGNQQAVRLAAYLCTSNVRFDAIYSSDLTRAYQTAWHIGAAMSVPVELLPPLREIDLGVWSGLTREQIRQSYPVEYTLLEKGEDIPRGNAETLAMLRTRVVGVIEAMVAQHRGRTLAFVSHGGSIRMMLGYVCDTFDLAATPCRHIGNTSLSVLHHETNKGWLVVSCNEMPHLANTDIAPDLMAVPPDDAERPVKPEPDLRIS